MNIPTWYHPNQTPTSKINWYLADVLVGCFRNGYSYTALKKILPEFTTGAIKTIHKRVSSGWSPTNDDSWVEFNKSVDNFTDVEYSSTFSASKDEIIETRLKLERLYAD
jgi:hypothetical protein